MRRATIGEVMPDQYDVIGGRWETTADVPLFTALHRSLPALAGDVRGLDVLDVATGTGVYARMWAAAGARRVVATDVSAEMVAAGEEIERTDPAGITYHVADGADHPLLDPFDLVTAAFLLNYAWDEDTLASMTRGLFENLRPGGRLVAALPRPGFPLDERPDLSSFGVVVSPVERIAIGEVARLTVLTEPPFAFEFVMARREVHERALARAGFAPPRWLPMHTPDPERPDPRLDGLAVVEPILLFETVRPG